MQTAHMGQCTVPRFLCWGREQSSHHLVSYGVCSSKICQGMPGFNRVTRSKAKIMNIVKRTPKKKDNV